MKKMCIGAATLAVVLGAAVASAIVEDNFNRSNSSTVGNGWEEGNRFGQLTGLEIRDNKLAAISSKGLIHRSVGIDFPVRIRAILHPGGCWNGGSEVTDHLFSTFMIRSRAEHFFDGFGIQVFRGDSTDRSPQVCRVKGGVTDVCTSPSSAWTSHDDVALDATIASGGEISGTVSAGTSSISFNFDETSFGATGNELLIGMLTACAGRPATLDALIISGVNDLAVTPTPTRTPLTSTSTHTRTRTPSEECAGDCDGDGRVTIDELVTGVNIALGNQSLSQCAEFDVSGNGQVSIDELILAVNNALHGCP